MKHKYLKDVSTLELSTDKCIGCGKCKEVCPHAVIEIENRKAQIIDKNACMECGACMNNCPVNAISVHAGVGCVSAVIRGWLTNSEPSCDCSGGSDCC
ncbi:MAG: 4Fe-4S ferredoxin iron-sulfur binding domain protein [Oscillospiraceae bacterium]|jgi:NAD-dependent dihydropyrimidine dehydrogenase PreA subunit|nr:4Fe-4S ferredoxin iron-sulfur binding domain protein [Oscillospiraceae bacterium]